MARWRDAVVFYDGVYTRRHVAPIHAILSIARGFKGALGRIALARRQRRRRAPRAAGVAAAVAPPMHGRARLSRNDHFNSNM